MSPPSPHRAPPAVADRRPGGGRGCARNTPQAPDSTYRGWVTESTDALDAAGTAAVRSGRRRRGRRRRGGRPDRGEHRPRRAGQGRRRPAGAGRAAGRGAPADRGRARASARRRWPRRWPRRSTRTVRRIQFTPDLLPSDVTGVAVYDQESREFEFKPGAVFANIVVADEINRASPKTQSALLECMEERQVTVDGVSYELARPFMVDGHAEPAGDGGHLSPPRGPARPVHRPGVDGLPRPGRRAGDARRPGDHRSADRRWRRSPTPPRCASWSPRSAGCTSPSRCAATSSPWSRPPAAPPTCGWAPRPAPACSCCAPPGPPAALAGRDHVLPDDVQAMAGAGAGAPAAADRRRRPRPPQHRAGGRRPAGHRPGPPRPLSCRWRPSGSPALPPP